MGTMPPSASPDEPPTEAWSPSSPRTTRAVLLVVVGTYAGMAAAQSLRSVASGLTMWGFAALMAMLAARRPARLGRARELGLVLLTFGIVLAGLTAPRWLARW
jgi:hypothetical protein